MTPRKHGQGSRTSRTGLVKSRHPHLATLAGQSRHLSKASSLPPETKTADSRST